MRLATRNSERDGVAILYDASVEDAFDEAERVVKRFVRREAPSRCLRAPVHGIAHVHAAGSATFACLLLVSREMPPAAAALLLAAAARVTRGEGELILPDCVRDEGFLAHADSLLAFLPTRPSAFGPAARICDVMRLPSQLGGRVRGDNVHFVEPAHVTDATSCIEAVFLALTAGALALLLL